MLNPTLQRHSPADTAAGGRCTDGFCVEADNCPRCAPGLDCLVPGAQICGGTCYGFCTARADPSGLGSAPALPVPNVCPPGSHALKMDRGALGFFQGVITVGYQCAECPPGRADQDQNPLTPCELCGRDTYSSADGSTDCWPCRDGFSTKRVMGSTNCFGNPDGRGGGRGGGSADPHADPRTGSVLGCNASSYRAESFLLPSEAGFDVGTVQGSLAFCEKQCVHPPSFLPRNLRATIQKIGHRSVWG